jgi:protein disulfide-isomerase
VTESQPETAAPTDDPPRPVKPPSTPLRPVLFIMAVFAGVMGVVAVSTLRTPTQRIRWRDDLPAALAEARAANKPVLLYFTAEWCGPCQYMKRNVFSDASVGQASEAYVPVRIDHDARPDLIVQYQVEGMPWFGVLDHDGRPVRILNRGVETPGEMIAWLKGE